MLIVNIKHTSTYIHIVRFILVEFEGLMSRFGWFGIFRFVPCLSSICMMTYIYYILIVLQTRTTHKHSTIT